MSQLILPGATLGVLGGGQLGRMFAIAARRLGYRVHVLVPEHDTPTGQVADLEVQAPYNDLDAVADFARNVDVVTFEFENVSVDATQTAEQHAPVRPQGSVLHTTQNRRREKTALRDIGLPVTPFQHVTSLNELQTALHNLGTPAVLKTAAWGYDGKGQIRINQPAHAQAAWNALNTDDAVLEAFIDFDCELSVVGARALDGTFLPYGPIRNQHHNHILDISSVPANLDPAIDDQAHEITRTIMEKLDVVGVLCVEFFLTPDRRLLINELAPRPHNSGHLTINAHLTCQFEQQVRAICGLPLGSNQNRAPAAMANLLGDLWNEHTPNWNALCALPDLKLHLYGKRIPRPGRKMGHITAIAHAPELATARVRHARNIL